VRDSEDANYTPQKKLCQTSFDPFFTNNNTVIRLQKGNNLLTR